VTQDAAPQPSVQPAAPSSDTGAAPAAPAPSAPADTQQPAQ
jgi:hypothetical protein